MVLVELHDPFLRFFYYLLFLIEITNCFLQGLIGVCCLFFAFCFSFVFCFPSYISVFMSCSDSVCSKCTKKNQEKLSSTNCKNYIHKSCSDLSWKNARSKNFGRFLHCNRCTEEFDFPFNYIKEHTDKT